jgi:hypothetical protein
MATSEPLSPPSREAESAVSTGHRGYANDAGYAAAVLVAVHCSAATILDLKGLACNALAAQRMGDVGVNFGRALGWHTHVGYIVLFEIELAQIHHCVDSVPNYLQRAGIHAVDESGLLGEREPITHGRLNRV